MKARTESGQVVGLASRIAYPVGRGDIEYRIVSDKGAILSEGHTLKLIVSSDEARQIARHFADIALQIEAIGGSRQ